MKPSPFITVFTPCYNRAYSLERLYHSLQQQTVCDFEWIVVDDGSSDNTQELFHSWCNEKNPFQIQYIKTVNGGKHRAINKGTAAAQGKMFFIVDSDDYLCKNAIEKIIIWESQLPKDERFAGVAAAQGFSENQMIGQGSGQEFVDCTSQKREQYGLSGDKAEVFYTDVLKAFPFPEFDGENFLTESIVWYAIGNAGYKIRWYDEILCICEYLEDGLSKNIHSHFERNPRGSRLALKTDLENRKLSVISRLGNYARYAKITVLLGETKKDAARDLKISMATLHVALFLKKIKDSFVKIKNK